MISAGEKSGDQKQIMLAVIATVGSAAGLAAGIPPPYDASAAGISIAATAAKQIIQAGEPHAPMQPFSHVDPRWAIEQGLIDPHTLLPKVDPFVNDYFSDALNWRPPRDPLVLDLDGDGIEATGIDAEHPVLFDHDASGSRTATGWIAPDDGLLVLDRDGNGTIDTGRELFGDNTLLSDGVTLAANGFDALSRYDTNVDHRVNALDPVYPTLHIWCKGKFRPPFLPSTRWKDEKS